MLCDVMSGIFCITSGLHPGVCVTGSGDNGMVSLLNCIISNNHDIEGALTYMTVVGYN